MRWLKAVAGAATVAPIVIVLRLLSVSYAGIAAPLLLLDVVVVARGGHTGLSRRGVARASLHARRGVCQTPSRGSVDEPFPIGDDERTRRGLLPRPPRSPTLRRTAVIVCVLAAGTASAADPPVDFARRDRLS